MSSLITPASAAGPPAPSLLGDLPSSFLSTPRAHAACEREFDRICTALIEDATRALAIHGLPAPDVRRAPSRTVVQARGAALSLTWLCGSTASVDTGELLAIVWRGTIAVRGDHIPERRAPKPLTRPVAVWEAALRPIAGDAATGWTWRAVERAPESSRDLATRLADRLVSEIPSVLDGSPA